MTGGPTIDSEVRLLAPGFRAISLTVEGDGTTGVQDASALRDACHLVRAGGPDWADAHLASWDRVYERFGAKPGRTPNSAAALRKRVLKDGEIPFINPWVDLYNAVSLRFAVPVGGENLVAYVGPPRLTIADGSEEFETMSNGEQVTDYPAEGEIIWRDDLGVTCRRWNWRQGIRTRLEPGCTSMWFILEALETMPESALNDAGQMLASGVERIMPGCRVRRDYLS